MINNIKTIFLSFLLFLITTGTVYAKDKEWTEFQMQQQFPKEKYICAIGFGKSEKEALNDSVSMLSKYFNTKVSSSIEISNYMKESEDSFFQNRVINVENFINSDSELYCLEFSDILYNKKTKNYSCVAYINKDTALLILLPKLDSLCQEYIAKFQHIITLDDNFNKVYAIFNEQPKLLEIYNLYTFCTILDSKIVNQYNKRIEKVSESRIKAFELAQQCKINLQVINDKDKRIEAKILNQLNNKKFIIRSTDFNYSMIVELIYEISKKDELCLSYPSIKISVFNNSQSALSFGRELKRCAGFDESSCIRNVMKEFENIIEEIL